VLGEGHDGAVWVLKDELLPAALLVELWVLDELYPHVLRLFHIYSFDTSVGLF
jgi:hypothetical protein